MRAIASAWIARSDDERLFAVVFGVVGALAVAAVLYGTRLGVGLANDSVNYLRAARGLLDGRGLIVLQAADYAGPVPMTHWPPLYPLLLAAASRLGADMEAFARNLNALLLAASAILIGRFALDRGCGLAVALAATLWFAANRDVLWVHQMVWTDALFLFAALLTFTLLARHLDAPRAALLWGASAAAALALMTRYVGIAVVAAGVLGVLVLSRERATARGRDLLRFASLPCLALALWALRNLRLAGASSYGHPEPRIPALAPLWRPIETSLEGWLWPFSQLPRGPGAWRAALVLAALLGAGAAAAHVAIRSRHAAAPPPAPGTRPRRSLRGAALLALYALCHLAFLYATVVLLFDAFVPETRHLIPAATASMLALVCVASRLAARSARTRWVAVAAACFGALVAVQVVNAARYQSDQSRIGFGFRDLRYTRSGLIALARRLPPGTPIFTNTQAVAALARMEDVRMLPAHRSPQRTDANPEYAAQLRDLERELRERRGVIIVFDGVGAVFPTAQELERELPLRLLLSTPQGRAFTARAPAPPP